MRTRPQSAIEQVLHAGEHPLSSRLVEAVLGSESQVFGVIGGQPRYQQCGTADVKDGVLSRDLGSQNRTCLLGGQGDLRDKHDALQTIRHWNGSHLQPVLVSHYDTASAQKGRRNVVGVPLHLSSQLQDTRQGDGPVEQCISRHHPSNNGAGTAAQAAAQRHLLPRGDLHSQGGNIRSAEQPLSRSIDQVPRVGAQVALPLSHKGYPNRPLASDLDMIPQAKRHAHAIEAWPQIRGSGWDANGHCLMLKSMSHVSAREVKYSRQAAAIRTRYLNHRSSLYTRLRTLSSQGVSMGILYVAGQTPGAGATAVCAALAVQWRRLGKRVALHQPLTLDAAAGEADQGLFAQVTGQREGQFDTHPYTGGKLDPTLGEALKAEVNVLKKENDAVVVQGLPATDAQGTQLEASAAMAQKLDCPVLGILSFDPEQEPASYEGTAKRWRETFGELLVGLVLNRRTRYASHLVESQVSLAISSAGTHLLATIPEDRSMLAPTVAQVAKHLDAQLFTEPQGHQRLVEQFIIGGLIMEWGGNYFGRFPRQAVLVRGGRIDIAMSALSFPMSCLVLTGTSEPPQYVYQRADEQQIPLMTVMQDTLEAAATLETIHQRVSVHHPDKVERFAGLLADSLRWEKVNQAVGIEGEMAV